MSSASNNNIPSSTISPNATATATKRTLTPVNIFSQSGTNTNNNVGSDIENKDYYTTNTTSQYNHHDSSSNNTYNI